MNNKEQTPVITIDGPSGTGKGTLCHLLANYLKWHFLDSGAIYRVLAFAAQKNEIQCNEHTKLIQLANQLELSFFSDEAQNTLIYLHEEEISSLIRSERCGQFASQIATIAEVREALLTMQRSFAKPPGLVTDGRDMGTVVFPDAIFKLFLYATPEERAQRRFLQLKESGNNASLAEVVTELNKRDSRDMDRSCAPLKPAHDGILIDTTGLTIEQVFENVVQLIDKRLKY